MVFTPTRVPLPLKGVGDLKRMHSEFPAIHSSTVFYFLDNVVWVAMRVGGVIVGIRLWKIRPRAVESAKLWLTMIAFLAFVQLAVQLSSWMIEAHGSLSAAAAAHPDNQDVLFRFAQSIIYWLVWYAYFVRSERVANTYPVDISRATLEGATP
jgi:hypothetical protein